MAHKSILELVTAFEQEALSRAELEAALNQQIQLYQRRQQELETARIQPEDQEIWTQELRPGLEACYEGLIGAAAEGLEYAGSRNQDLLPGIAGLLQEVDRIRTYLESRAGLAGSAARAAVQDGLGSEGDGLALSPASQGSADSQVAFVDQEPTGT